MTEPTLEYDENGRRIDEPLEGECPCCGFWIGDDPECFFCSNNPSEEL